MDELAVIGAKFDGDVNVGLRELDARGFGAIVPKLQDGQAEVNVGVVADLKRRIAELGLRRLRLVGGWAQNRTWQGARDDAEKSNGLLVREGCDPLWVSACEDDTYKGDPGSEKWSALATFVDRALEIEPLRTVMLVRGGWGFCYLPNEPAGQFFDWASVRRAKGRAVPQCYPNEFPDAPSQWPHEAQDLAVRGFSQFPKAFAHPLVGGHKSRKEVTVPDYLASLDRAKREFGFTTGYAIYGAHHLTRDEWDAWGAVNKPGGTTGEGVFAKF